MLSIKLPELSITFVNFLRKLSNKKKIIKQSGPCILAIFLRVGQGNIQVHSVFIMKRLFAIFFYFPISENTFSHSKKEFEFQISKNHSDICIMQKRIFYINF